MQKISVVRIFMTLTLILTSLNLVAKDADKAGKDGLKTEIKEFIDHHLLDSHDFTLFSDKETGKHYGIP